MMNKREKLYKISGIQEIIRISIKAIKNSKKYWLEFNQNNWLIYFVATVITSMQKKKKTKANLRNNITTILWQREKRNSSYIFIILNIGNININKTDK